MIEILPRVLWMFCPPGLRAGHVTESCELMHVIFKCLACCLGGQLTRFCVCVSRPGFSVVRLKRPNWSLRWAEHKRPSVQPRNSCSSWTENTHAGPHRCVCVWERESVWLLLLCMCLSLHLLPARIKYHALTSEDIHTNMQRITLEHKCLSCMWVVSN